LAAAMLLAIAVVIADEPAQAAFPGENGKIVFTELAPDGLGRIKLIKPDGSGPTTLVNRFSLGGVHFTYGPAMSPGGTRVAFAARSGSRRNTEIYMINIRTRTVTQITDNKVFDGDPAWSPDGTRVAFVREFRGKGGPNTDIFVRRADGTGKTTNATQTPGEDELAPAWSPKGEEIAFHTAESTWRYYSPIDVFVMSLTTGQRRNLTNDGTVRRDEEPNWSPDGTRIVFESYDGPVDSINTMNASDGSDKRLLAQGHRNPDWDEGFYFVGATYSPDGKKIAYVGTDWDAGGTPIRNAALYKMNASDGSNKQVIHNAGGNGAMSDYEALYYPDWGRKPLR
jgi:TolB protein